MSPPVAIGGWDIRVLHRQWDSVICCGHWLWPWTRGSAVGRHDDHEAKTTGDGQVAKGTVIPPAPRDDGGRHGKDDGDSRDSSEEDQDEE